MAGPLLLFSRSKCDLSTIAAFLDRVVDERHFCLARTSSTLEQLEREGEVRSEHQD